MFPLGHLGLTVALVEGVRRGVLAFRIDYRFLLIGALLPDFIDKPLSLALGLDGRAIAHTLLFAAFLTLFLLAVARPSGRVEPAKWSALLLGLTIGTWTHLLLDRMWALPEVLLWPFLGLGFPLDPFDLFSLLAGYQDPYVLIGDIVGTAALGYFAWRHRIYRRANFVRFLREGRLEPGKTSPHSRRTTMRAMKRAAMATPAP